jgi:branched-chain amino acid transport system substrate-binding protein
MKIRHLILAVARRGWRLSVSITAAYAYKERSSAAVHRTGPTRQRGAMANGKQDYIKMVNARDGGINGVKLTYEEAVKPATPPTGAWVLRTPEGRPGVTLFDPQATGITLRY